MNSTGDGYGIESRLQMGGRDTGPLVRYTYRRACERNPFANHFPLAQELTVRDHIDLESRPATRVNRLNARVKQRGQGDAQIRQTIAPAISRT